LAFCFEDTRFGTCTGVHLPDSVAAASLLASLHPEERELCRSMRGTRLVEFAGGRHASRLAREGMKAARAPTLTGANGAPDVAGRVRISLSHTQKLAAALASSDARYAIGGDIEAIATDGGADHLR
jgi:4'-phosphopantetheinyl transferase EntD